MRTRRASSFRLRLALQTMLVAGVVVAGFGASAWWFALGQQARNHDLQLVAEARRLWTQLTPRDREEAFAQAVDKIFEGHEQEVAVTVIWHTADNPLVTLAGPVLNDSNRSMFLTRLPRGDGVVTSGVNFESMPRPARAASPGLGNLGSPRRPLMPEIRPPEFFTYQDTGEQWRFGAFSNPHYTVFVGLSRTTLEAATHATALWFAGGGLLALIITGLGAWWASGRAIRPLDRIVRMADRMVAGSLDQRIPLLDGDDREFAQLIGALNNMTTRLERSFEQSTRFTADASHELKTPLAVIQSTLNDVLRSEALDEESQQRINIALHQVARLKHITRSLLLLSQTDAGELPINREHYDLSRELEGLMDDAEALCDAAGLVLTKEIESGVFIEADRALMHQIFQNLLSNAVKHNRANGTVRIHLGRDPRGGTRFEIHNTSATITDDEKRQLFDRFYRAEASRSGEGFGLGLNIARELARANGAHLELLTAENGMIGFSVTWIAPEAPIR